MARLWGPEGGGTADPHITHPGKGRGTAPDTMTWQGRSPLSASGLSPVPPRLKPSRGQRARGPDDVAHRGQPPRAHHRAEDVSEWSGMPSHLC